MQRSSEQDERERVDPASLLDDDAPDTVESAEGPTSGSDRTGRDGSTGGGRLRRLLPSRPRPLRGSFSARSFLVVLALSLAGVIAGGSIPLVGTVGQFLGLFLVAFVVGAVGARRRYLEVGLAGAIAAGIAFVLGTLTSVFAPVAVQVLADYGVAIAGVGTGAGLLASLAGHYFGRDLRDGLTRDV
ncbi:hypothetical protein [Halobellus limi]|uniref:DUF456 domain-containing protein n=1 Tax=Halobellus limi TaxID=699433 RepID=A0A1H5UQE8_9EURY|nr:hypothetical protein [Halobellus limi]QCC46982.1 hypothetical protein DV707_04465 [Halobellus limi]SEF76417.1 hypothetical protein SAMN04488133_0659 [Halobellus limi]